MSHHRDLIMARDRVINLAVEWRRQRWAHSLCGGTDPACWDVESDLHNAVTDLEKLLATIDGEAPAAPTRTSIAAAKQKLSAAVTWRGRVQRAVMAAGRARDTDWDGVVGTDWDGVIGGMTCDELEVALPGPHTSVSSAVNYAREHGWIERSGLTRLTRAGCAADVYQPTQMLIDLVAEEVFQP